MFLFKSITGKIFGNQDSEEMNLAGEFHHLIQQSTVHNTISECLYLNSVISIQKTSQPNYYNLVVSRVFEEGEEELENSEDSEEQEDEYYERVFLISEKMNFIKKTWESGDGEGEKKMSFYWSNISEDDNTKEKNFVFVPDTNVISEINAFEEAVMKCLYKTKYKVNKIEAYDFNVFLEDYKENCLRKKKMSASPLNQKSEISKPSPGISTSLETKSEKKKIEIKKETSEKKNSEKIRLKQKEDTSQLKTTETIKSTKDVKKITEEKLDKKNPDLSNENSSTKKESVNQPKGNELYSLNHDIYIYDINQSKFRLISSDAMVKIINIGKFKYSFFVNGDEITISQEINSEMNEIFNDQFNSFIWCSKVADDKVYTWSIVFKDKSEKEEFQWLFNQCKFEALQKKAYEKANAEELDYLMKIFDTNLTLEEKDELNENSGSNEPISTTYYGENDSDNENGIEEEEEEEEEEVQSEEEEKKIIRNSNKSNENGVFDDGLINKELAVAYKYDRSFVVRGNKIGVFKHTDDEKLKYVTTIDNIQGLDKWKFVPENLMLHEQDESMLMLNRDADVDGDENKIYKMDLNRGKIVEEWDTGYEYIKGIAPSSKYSQLTPEKTFVGFRNNSLFLLDPRLSEKQYIDVKYQYTTNFKFSCIATTGNGEIALANEKGGISLYNRIGIKAKNFLPNLGDPIIGIDVTEDGNYIIATTKTYLLFIDGKEMFTKTISKERKPKPRKLQLRPEDLAYINESISFTPARFDIGEGLEKSIITSTGQYMITWNLRRLKNGYNDSYRIRRCNDKVVAENFRYNESKNIVVTLPNNVAMTTDKAFKSSKLVFKKRRN